MEHGMYDVDLLDRDGKIVGQKSRYQINKPHDIYHTIHIILITPRGELVLSTIPVREDLPNYYARKVGTTVATIRRSGESAAQAARRAISRELFIDEMSLIEAGGQMFTHEGGMTNFATLFYGIAEPPESYSILDIDSLIVMTPREFKHMLEDDPDNVAASLADVWQAYNHKLPL